MTIFMTGTLLLFMNSDPDHHRHLGPCGKEELLHLWVGGNVGKSGKEMQQQMRRMTIEE